MAEIYNAIKDCGVILIGSVDASSYSYDDSEAVVDGKFVGLAIDVAESDSQTNERISKWVEEIKTSL